jgi:hypothetical protein
MGNHRNLDAVPIWGGSPVTEYSDTQTRPLEDPVSNVLKWILLAVGVGSLVLFAWATVLT